MTPLDGPPARDPRYQHGPSTPRPVRLNDALWADFVRVAAARGWSAPEALRWLVEQFAATALSPRQGTPDAPAGVTRGGGTKKEPRGTP